MMVGVASAVALLLAFANGSNDNFKGVATLFGSGAARYRGVLAWATLTTLLGSLAAIALGGALGRAFAGNGLLPVGPAPPGPLLASAGLGAALSVLLASRLGMPISTTHALLGGLVGAGFVASAGALHYSVLIKRFVLPLLASPVLSFTVAAALYPGLDWLRRTLGVKREVCICVVPPVAMAADTAALAFSDAPPRLMAAPAAACESRYSDVLMGFDVRRTLDGLHFLSAGLVSFARGLNDTPKIASLMLVSSWVHTSPAITAVAVAMALGGWCGARPVAETMSFKITPLNHAQGFTANIVTAGLVILASFQALPVSMTHVSVGALVGVGALDGQARWHEVRRILLAWCLTLPGAAVIGAALNILFGRIHL